MSQDSNGSEVSCVFSDGTYSLLQEMVGEDVTALGDISKMELVALSDGMGKTRYVEKENKMGLQVQEKKEGKMVTRFVPHSNFVYHPIAQLEGEKTGFLMAIKTFPLGTEFQAHVPSNPKRDKFVCHLNKALCIKGGGGLSCSLPDRIFKSQFMKKILKLQKSNSSLKAVKTLGKVRNDNVWVLTDKVQIDSKGQQVSSDYVYVPDDSELQVVLGQNLSVLPLRDTLREMRKTLQHNFPAAVFALGGVSMINHAEIIGEVFDGCPTVILVGESGRGKSTALKLGLSSLGLLQTGMMKSFSKEKVLQRSSTTTMGIFIDDPPNSAELKELIVDFFNRSCSATIGRGVESVRCGLMITANDAIAGSNRELRRVVYVPFLGKSIAGNSTESVKAHVQVKTNINSSKLSGAVPSFIAAGGTFRQSGWRTVAEKVFPWVQERFKGKVLPDCALPYAVLLWFTKEIYRLICGQTDDVHFIEKFFENTIVPFAVAHQPMNTIDSTSLYSNADDDGEKFQLFNSLGEQVQTILNTHSKEEIRTVLKYGLHKGTECIALHPSFFEDTNYTQQQVYSHLIKAGMGFSQPRRFPGSRKSERCLVMSLNCLTEDLQVKVREYFDGQKHSVAAVKEVVHVQELDKFHSEQPPQKRLKKRCQAKGN